jgi:hypothetical protein
MTDRSAIHAYITSPEAERRFAIVFNALGKAIHAEDAFVNLTGRERITLAVLTALEEAAPTPDPTAALRAAVEQLTTMAERVMEAGTASVRQALADEPCTEQGHPDLTQNPALQQPCLRTGSHYVHQDASGNRWKRYADSPQ